MRIIIFILGTLHKSKIVEGFLGEAKLSTAVYSNVREERKVASTTKSPTRFIYVGCLFMLFYMPYSYGEDGEKLKFLTRPNEKHIEVKYRPRMISALRPLTEFKIGKNIVYIDQITGMTNARMQQWNMLLVRGGMNLKM